MVLTCGKSAVKGHSYHVAKPYKVMVGGDMVFSFKKPLFQALFSHIFCL